MNRTLLNLLLGLIRQNNTDLAPVRNLLGNPVFDLANNAKAPAASNWKIYSLPDVINSVPWSPDEIMNHITTLQMEAAPVLDAINGITIFNCEEGTTLATTIVTVPQAVSVRVEVDAVGQQIAIYAHETLIQRGSNSVVTFVNFSAGKTALNIVTQGSQNSTVILNLPPDITTDFTAFVPPKPTWLASGTINTNYIDPSTGQVGVQLFWNNQSNVGGWDVYKVFSNDFGTIQQCSTVDGKYIIITDFSGTALLPYPGSVGVISINYIGILENATYSTEYNNSTFRFKPFDSGDSVFSGTLSTFNFSNIAVVNRNSNDSVVSYTDMHVQMGTTYLYTLDSFSIIDPTLRSDKIDVLTVTTPNIPLIGLATLTEQTAGYLTLALSVIDNQVRYWSAWIRKNNWPTVLSGSATAQLNNDYLKFYDEDVSQTTFTFTATNGFWYGIVVPYDANNNAGPRTLCSGLVDGTGVTANIPTITQIGIDQITTAAGLIQNKIWWTTNIAGERPDTANGAIQVQILLTNTTNGFNNFDITSPNPRFLWQDWEDTQSNSNDTSNSKVLYGSMQDTNSTVQNASTIGGTSFYPKFSVCSYIINILSGTQTLGTYHTQIGDTYSLSSSGGGGRPKL